MNDEISLKDRLLGIGTEVGTGIGTDVATSGLLAGGPFGWLAYAGINFGSGAYTNYLVQKHLYGQDNVNWGEILASGAMGMIPFMDVKVGKLAGLVGKTGTVQRGIVGGALTGLGGEQLRVGIDEQRFLNPLEAAISVGVGGGLGGGLTRLTQRRNLIPEFDPTGNQIKTDAVTQVSQKLGVDPEVALQQQGLKHRMMKHNDGLGSEDIPDRQLDIEFFDEQVLINKYQEMVVTDPTDPNYGSLVSDVTAAAEIYGKPARAFFNLSRRSRTGRLFDLKTGKFSLEELKRRYPSDADKDFRREVQALAADERFGKGTFNRVRAEQLEDWILGIEDIAQHVNPKEFETHHIRSIRHVGALIDGMTRRQRAEFNQIMLKSMFTVGNNPENLILLNKKAHKRLHDRLNEEIGKYADKFINPDITYTFDEKVEIAKEMGAIINKLTKNAYEEVADFMVEKYTIASPSARMAAEIDIAELEARIDFVLDQYFKYLNQDGLGVIQSRIKDLDYETEVRQVQQDTPPPDLRRWRLGRGRGKKTLERIKRNEELYGTQLKLDM